MTTIDSDTIPPSPSDQDGYVSVSGGVSDAPDVAGSDVTGPDVAGDVESDATSGDSASDVPPDATQDLSDEWQDEAGPATGKATPQRDASDGLSEGDPVDATDDEAPLPRLDEGLPLPPDDAEITRLREMLFARELRLLDRVRAELEDPEVSVRRTSDILAEAVHMRAGKDLHLSMAMQPIVDAIIKKAFHTRRSDFVNALSPLMGPTIRKSISESFQSMMGSFSKSVEMAFSWKGLRWRFEALRSGKPFSEIVMLNTIVYRVEQLFFIHSETGLVLSHVAEESVKSQDADMVSAMLTAIQDFVRDCFSGGPDEELHSLKMGEFTIYIESGPRAYLACAVRGTPPAEFHQQLRATLDLLHVEFADAFENFDGDTEVFAGAVPFLQSCLVSHYRDEDKPVPLWAKLMPLLLVLGLAAGGVLFYHNRRQAAAERARVAAVQEGYTRAMHRAVDLLRAEPGLMIANVQEAPTPPWKLLVLRDALGRAPEDVLREKGVDPRYFSMRTIPFMSYDPSIVVRRVKESIQPPDTVTMTFDAGGTLTFTGTAPMSWIVSTREDARAIPGVERVDISGVRDPMMEQITSLIDRVEATVIEFPLGKDAPVGADAEKLKKAVDTLVELENITKGMGFTASLTIYGHADSVGDAKRNYEISQSRARTVASMLYAKGSSMPVSIYGMGSQYPRAGEAGTNGESQASRRIELRVHFALSPSASPELFRR